MKKLVLTIMAVMLGAGAFAQVDSVALQREQEALRQQSEQRPKRLPSNFAYNTMRRIEKEQQAREWRERVVVTIAIVVSFLLGVGIMVFFYIENIIFLAGHLKCLGLLRKR